MCSRRGPVSSVIVIVVFVCTTLKLSRGGKFTIIRSNAYYDNYEFTMIFKSYMKVKLLSLEPYNASPFHQLTINIMGNNRNPQNSKTNKVLIV